MKRYQAKAAGSKIDPIGYAFVPFGYTNGQILEQAVTATKSLDHDVLAKYIHSHSSQTVVGEISFGKDGEWAKPRMVLTQFQNIEPNNVEQFRGRREAADPVAAGIQDRRHDLSVRERAKEVDRNETPHAMRRRMRRNTWGGAL